MIGTSRAVNTPSSGAVMNDPKITFAQVQQTKADLFAARLDLAEKKEDRIKICEGHVKDAEAWEQSVRKRAETSRELGIASFQAQAYVLETRKPAGLGSQ
jgi:hypothetical protein